MAALLLPSALAGLAVGIVAAEPLAGASVDIGPTALAAAPVLAAGLLLRWRPLVVLGVIVLTVALGAWRGSAVALPTGAGSVAAMVGPEERDLTGTAVDDPRPRGERQQVVIDQVEVIGPAGVPVALDGRVLLWLPRHAVVASPAATTAWRGSQSSTRPSSATGTPAGPITSTLSLIHI